MSAEIIMASESTLTPVSLTISSIYLRDALILDFLGSGNWTSYNSATCPRASPAGQGFEL
jgi:hypothetical protein